MILNAVSAQFGRRRRGVISVVVIGVILVAAGVRLPSLFDTGMHPDEALFATWARLIGTWQSPLLRGETIDKPPLLFYLQAPFFPLLGTAEFWVTRLPNLAASILVVPLTMRFAWNLYGAWMAPAVAGILLVFSPLLRAFSGTSFTDPLMTALLMAALMMICLRRSDHGRRRAFVAGLLIGLAILTKYQAALFIPLQLGLAWLNGYSRREWRSWCSGLLAPILCLLLWSQLRGATLDLLQLQMANYGGLRASWSWELWPRLEQWAVLWGGLIDAPVFVFGLILLSPVFLALLIQRQDRDTAMDQLLLIFLLAYVILHWFIAVPIWERYLLPIAPLAFVLLGRFVTRVVDFLGPSTVQRKRWLEAATVCFIAAQVALPALAGNGRHASQRVSGSVPESAAHVADFLSDAPYGTVLYDHWFSWQLRYALFDSRVFVSWFPHPEALVDDLDAFLNAGEKRYVLAPRQPQAIVLLRTLRDAGYRPIITQALPDMILYQIESQ